MQTTSSLDRASSASRAGAHTRNASAAATLAVRPRPQLCYHRNCVTISRAARRWMPRRRLLRRQLRLPRIRPGALLALVRHLSSTAAARRNAARRGGRLPRLPPAAVPNTDSAADRMPAQATSTAPQQPAWLRLHGDTSPELDYRHHAIVTWALLDKGQSVAQRSQVRVTHPPRRTARAFAR